MECNNREKYMVPLKPFQCSVDSLWCFIINLYPLPISVKMMDVDGLPNIYMYVLTLFFSSKLAGKARTLRGVRISSRGSSIGSNTLGSAPIDSQSMGEETPSQMVEEVLATPTKKSDLQSKVKDFNILSHVGKLCKEFKSTLKTRYYKEMVEEEAKFTNMMDARDKKYKALLNECMAKGISIEFQTKGLDDEAFSSDDDE
ncbi:hypothetical protein GOBAR_DD17591 [Gossypium barbadense]|nr:hypothetical protein GOBAR_DD17591 [Gossypium barbadense]